VIKVETMFQKGEVARFAGAGHRKVMKKGGDSGD
jgi:hypothetical protein